MKLLQKFISQNDWETGIAYLKITKVVFSLLAIVTWTLLALDIWRSRQPPQPRHEIAFWRSVSPSQPAELQLYLKTWPHGAFVSLAKLRLKELHEETKQVAPGCHQ